MYNSQDHPLQQWCETMVSDEPEGGSNLVLLIYGELIQNGNFNDLQLSTIFVFGNQIQQTFVIK